MRLINCYIANFGLHHDKKIDFNPGLNSFYWKNGEGKTTLTVFIKAMLYGFGDNRSDEERKKYYPWQGGKYGGSLTFEAGGKTYVVERTFGIKPADDTFVLRDERTGGVSNYYSENLGFELFGIDREGFMRTAFLSEKSLTPKERINPTVASRLSDMMGSDGDVGNFKDAIKDIDEERKKYSKRGGGEIKELEAEISELNGKLDDLERIAVEADECFKDLNNKEAEIKDLEARQKKHYDRLAEIEKAKERQKHSETYKEYLAKLQDVEGKIAELEKFFGGSVPTSEEINSVKEARAEANRLRGELENGSEANEELNRLSAIYGGGNITLADIDEVDREMRSIRERKNRLSEIECGVDDRSQEMKRLFPTRLPDEAEIDENIKKAGEKTSSTPKFLLFSGIAAAVIGLVLGLFLPVLFSICAVGVVLAVIGLVLGRGNSANGRGEAEAFLREIAPSYSGDVLGNLYAKKNDLQRYKKLAALRDEERTELAEKLYTGRQKVNIFFAKLGDGYPQDEETVVKIRSEYYSYNALMKNEEESASGRSEKRRREEELRTLVNGFVRRYPTQEYDPIAEIERKQRELVEHKNAAANYKETCDSFAARYGVNGEDEPFDADEEGRINAELSDISADIGIKKGERNSLEYKHTRLLEMLEAEPEINAKLLAKRDRLEICKHNFVILDIAKELLTKAHDNMTERYTGPTNERFTHYMKVITGVEGEYRLDTAFGITAVDKGEMHSESEYSRGTKDLYALAMRLALTDSLYEGELPFLVLDDPFISYDDERGTRARGLLTAIAKERQILYFTCSESRDI